MTALVFVFAFLLAIAIIAWLTATHEIHRANIEGAKRELWRE